MRNILWAISDRMGCGTYRAYIPALSLKERGTADSAFVTHEEAYHGGMVNLDDMDALVLQRACYPFFKDWVIEAKRRGIKVLLEFDDDLWHVPQHSPAHDWWRRKDVHKILKWQIEQADLVLVSTRPLAERIAEEMRWPTLDKIRICHNHLHPAVWGRDVWASVVPYENKHLVIGWQGSLTHDIDFSDALPALKRVVQEYPNVMVRFFGCVPMSVKDQIPESRFQWSRGVPFEKYPTTLRYVNFDIGLAPIIENKFNRCKSNLKFLEYAALSTPCVASRVYPYARTIQDGTTGFIASGEEEWYDKIVALVEDALLRRTMGRAAHAYAWQEWSADQHIVSWESALAEVWDGQQLVQQQPVSGPEFWGAARS